MRFSPSGLIRIDPADVVSDGKAQRYEVLPQESGIVAVLDERITADAAAGALYDRQADRPLPRRP